MAIPTGIRRYHWAVHGSQTVSNTAVGFTAANIKPTSGDLKGIKGRCVRVSIETASIRWRVDGTDPTTTTGTKQDDGDEFYIEGATEVSRFRAIRISTDATMKYDVGF